MGIQIHSERGSLLMQAMIALPVLAIAMGTSVSISRMATKSSNTQFDSNERAQMDSLLQNFISDPSLCEATLSGVVSFDIRPDGDLRATQPLMPIPSIDLGNRVLSPGSQLSKETVVTSIQVSDVAQIEPGERAVGLNFIVDWEKRDLQQNQREHSTFGVSQGRLVYGLLTEYDPSTGDLVRCISSTSGGSAPSPTPSIQCSPGQTIGFNVDGTQTCVAQPSGGSTIRRERCNSDEYMRGIKSNGRPLCEELPDIANKSCRSGYAVTGFERDGEPICSRVDGGAESEEVCRSMGGEWRNRTCQFSNPEMICNSIGGVVVNGQCSISSLLPEPPTPQQLCVTLGGRWDTRGSKCDLDGRSGGTREISCRISLRTVSFCNASCPSGYSITSARSPDGLSWSFPTSTVLHCSGRGPATCYATCREN